MLCVPILPLKLHGSFYLYFDVFRMEFAVRTATFK